MQELYKFKKEEKEMLEKIAESDKEQLKNWELKLAEATDKVEYWKNQVENSSGLALRATIQGWK